MDFAAAVAPSEDHRLRPWLVNVGGAALL